MAATTTPAADDLLAQLAGDEIDRLLQEAEAAPQPPVTAAARVMSTMAATAISAPQAEGESNTSDDGTGAEIDRLLAESQSPATTETPVADPNAIDAKPSAEIQSSDASAEIVAERSTDAAVAPVEPQARGAVAESDDAAMAADAIDQLIVEAGKASAVDGVQEDRPATTAPSASVSEPVVAPAAIAPAETSPTAKSEFDNDEVLARTMDSLLEQVNAEVSSNADAAKAPAPGAPTAAPTATEWAAPAGEPTPVADPEIKSATSEQDDDNPPLIIRVLEWINTPFDWLPDILREAAGKVAVLTMINAIGVLVYVLVFRRHPGH